MTTTTESRIQNSSGGMPPKQDDTGEAHDEVYSHYYYYDNIESIPLHDVLKLQSQQQQQQQQQNHQEQPKMTMISSSATTESHPAVAVPLLRPVGYGVTGPVSGVTAWNYSVFIGASLVVWVAYLILPKGVRKEYFGAYPKRFAKTPIAVRKQGIGRWIYPTSTNGSASMCSMSRDNSSLLSGSATEKYLAEIAYARKVSQVMISMQDSREEQQQSTRRDLLDESGELTPLPSLMMHSAASITSASFHQGRDRYDATGPGGASVASSSSRTGGSSSWDPPWRSFRQPPKQQHNMDSSILPSIGEHSKPAPPSPNHPNIHRPPNSTVISDTMFRLKERGIRLVAHGVQCEPKRVWIRLDDETMTLSWQTEFPRRIPTASNGGEGSIVLVRGSIHTIALPNVLYVDVGKKTNALQKPSNVAIPDIVCFSLLTQNGSLDLQTNSMLERDALVCCFSVLLDKVHQDRDWRALYEEGSSVFTGTEVMMSGMVEI
jgi:hypothetical protein